MKSPNRYDRRLPAAFRSPVGLLAALLALALAGGAGLALAAPRPALDSSIQRSARWVKETIELNENVGAHASLAFDPGSGTPWISYYDSANTALKAAHYVGKNGNCGVDDAWRCETVDDSGNVGMFSAIDIYPGSGSFPIDTRRVGIAYYDAGNQALKFAEYSCFPSCAWNIVTIQDAAVYLGAPSYGQYASFRYTENGDPLIAYSLSNPLFADEVRYAYRLTGGGNCGEGSAAGKWQCDTVDSGDFVGSYTSLDYSQFAGVYIAYYDGNAGDLKYAYYTGFGGNCGSGNAWYCITVDGTDGSDVGKVVSLHAPTGAQDRLQMAYYDQTHGKLKYAVQTGGSGGNCGPGNSFRCSDIESVGTGAERAVSLSVDSDNQPMIAYQDVGLIIEPMELKIAQPAAALGLLYGNCGPEMPFSTWQCSVIDSGSVHADEARYASLAFRPGGLAMTAYAEQLDTHGAFNLKIAYQVGPLFLPAVTR